MESLKSWDPGQGKVGEKGLSLGSPAATLPTKMLLQPHKGMATQQGEAPES